MDFNGNGSANYSPIARANARREARDADGAAYRADAVALVFMQLRTLRNSNMLETTCWRCGLWIYIEHRLYTSLTPIGVLEKVSYGKHFIWGVSMDTM